MTIKEVKPINFLYFRTETKVADLVNFLPVSQELFKEAVLQKIAITGAVHWHYFGFNGDENQYFTLEVALPVGDIPQEYDGKFHVKRTTPYKCVSLTHEGSWLDIPHTYQKLMQFVHEHQLKPSAINREIYVNADFNDPAANVTEVQLGIQ